MEKRIVGWDIGGAHVKTALLAADGSVLAVKQTPCPLWKGMGYLHQTLTEVLEWLGPGDYRHAITMTGELADCFSGREEGVYAILKALRFNLGNREMWVFAGKSGFIQADAVESVHTMAIASANWLASAELAARNCREGLFVDIGSTTTDILLIANHVLQALGFTDYARLVSGELLYTGVVRTPVMAIAMQAEFKGRRMGLMAEFFAAMSDVYRLTGDLQEEHDQYETADGAEKSAPASARRLSRLTGYEFLPSDMPVWLDFARFLKNRQKQLILEACRRQISRIGRTEGFCLIGAGVGRFLLKEIADAEGLPYRDFNDFLPTAAAGALIGAADCAPAAAVAYLCLGFC